MAPRRTDFSRRLPIPAAEGANACRTVGGHNADHGVTWVPCYVSDDKRKSFCVYDASSQESIRKAAELNALPVDQLTQVAVVDPYFNVQRPSRAAAQSSDPSGRQSDGRHEGSSHVRPVSP